MTFYDQGRTKLFDSIEAKWDEGPEPTAPAAQLMANPAQASITQSTTSLFNSAMIPFAHRIVIPSDVDGKSYAVVVKHQGQNECYAFNGWSYQYPNWSNPNWMIGTGQFIVEIRAVSGTVTRTKRFVLRNNGPNLTDVSLAES